VSAKHDPTPVPSEGHERRDIAPRPIVLAGAGLAVVVIVLAALMYVLFTFLAGRESKESPSASPLSGSYGRLEPPAPHLQTRPVLDLQALRGEESAALRSYAWVDRDGGVVRIPIERAMALVAERGLPSSQGRPEGGAR